MAQDARRTAQWKRIRARILASKPSCVRCGRRHDLSVDHIVALVDGGEPFDAANLQVLCRKCNTAKENRARAARRSRTVNGGGRLIVLMGPPGAGKSTYAASISDAHVVSVDAWRAQIGQSEDDQTVTARAFESATREADALLAQGRTVVFDATHLSSQSRDIRKRNARRMGAVAELHLVDTPDNQCLLRNALRQRPIPEVTLRQMLAAYRAAKARVWSEGWDRIVVLDEQLEAVREHHRGLSGQFLGSSRTFGRRGSLETCTGSLRVGPGA